MDCIFCKIIKGEIPCYKIYEDENVLAFLDIMPVSDGHTLVIPKKHYKNIEEIPENELCDLIKEVKKIGKAIKNSLCAAGYNVNINNGQIAGQVVPHLHFHIIPRKQGDGLKLWQQGKYKKGDAEKIIKKIKNSL
ncbi:MAG: HIT family protein [Patescibacteria group bacterium]|nr:HIT family protein [Patescibacteria group bacterium]